MRIAFWTAFALARPFHALQRWWQDPKESMPPATNSLSVSMGAVPSFTMDGTDLATNHSKMTENIVVERMHPAPTSYRPSALAPIHSPSLCSLGATTASQKVHRIGSRPAATRRHGTQRPVRMLHGSASTAEAGHFFIAGRVADVCAELERLAAHEAAH